MSDDRGTLLLTITNIALGAIVVAAVIGVATGVVCDLARMLKRRHSVYDELDHDMHKLFGGSRTQKK
jgi:hypothetical protein